MQELLFKEKSENLKSFTSENFYSGEKHYRETKQVVECEIEKI